MDKLDEAALELLAQKLADIRGSAIPHPRSPTLTAAAKMEVGVPEGLEPLKESWLSRRVIAIQTEREKSSAVSHFRSKLPEAFDRLVSAHIAMEAAQRELENAGAGVRSILDQNPERDLTLPLLHAGYLIAPDLTLTPIRAVSEYLEQGVARGDDA